MTGNLLYRAGTFIDGSIVVPPDHLTNGGAVLQNANIKNVFVGTGWLNGVGAKTRASVDAFSKSMDEDPVNQIAAFYGAFSEHFEGSEVVPIDQGILTDSLIQQIATQVANGVPPDQIKLNFDAAAQARSVTVHLKNNFGEVEEQVKPHAAAASSRDNNEIIDIMPYKGVEDRLGDSTTHAGLDGWHGVLPDGRLYSIEQIASVGNGIDFNENALDGLTVVWTHEILEARTDPYLGSGVVDAKGLELGDFGLNEANLGLNRVGQCGPFHHAIQIEWYLPDGGYETAPGGSEAPQSQANPNGQAHRFLVRSNVYIAAGLLAPPAPSRTK
jgi:hypothetical protein